MTKTIERLLIIDPQNDFCDLPASALPVPGSCNDLLRLASFIDTCKSKIDDIVVSLDSHPTIAIERPDFWRTTNGNPPAPFTVVTAKDVQAHLYVPANESLYDYAIEYCTNLQNSGKYTLMLWPAHCVLGTNGHAVFEPLMTQIMNWERFAAKNSTMILKGMHPLTEQYSAVKAEIPIPNEPLTQTNTQLVNALFSAPNNEQINVFVAGEALSHCVKATLEDLMQIAPQNVTFTLLTDACSPVASFEQVAQNFINDIKSKGVNCITTENALQLLGCKKPNFKL